MMDAPAAKFLWDAKTAAERITRFTAGRSLDDYLADEMLRAAVERQFEIVGEALAALRRVAPNSASRIPDLARIVAFWNILVHGYATVDDRLVWGIVEGDLAGLRATLERLLSGLSGSENL
jgi:uncharacterized protein with HEPN domain